MAALGIVEDGAPTKHVVHVSWFGRDPGGATIFVVPPAEDGAASDPVVESDGGAALPHH
jgi:hypothetical protein